MMQVKAGKPLIEMVRLCRESDVPLLLSGRPGIGKSDLLKAAAKELGIGCICRDLSIMDPPDLVQPAGSPGKRHGFCRRNFCREGADGLFIIEELNREDRHMRAPCLQLLTDRCLNDYRLPKGWLPMAAINPFEDGKNDVDDLDEALLSRFTRVERVRIGTNGCSGRNAAAFIRL